jgi:hypothetical protein
MATDVSNRSATPPTLDRPDERSPAGLPIPPLAVGGLVVTRAALVAALRLYVPQVVDISTLDDGRFLLHLAGDPPAEERIAR